MRTRLLTACAFVGLAAAGTLFTFNRSTARDAVVPSEPKCDAGSTCQSTCRQVRGYEVKAKVVETVPTMIVNTRRIKLNYSVAEVGPSGVSAVELWATRDGRTWQRYSNEPPPAGPLVVHVAEEGRYGFSIVVTSGAGVKSPPPEIGDAPQLWVEVDETRPVVKVKEVAPGTGRDAGTLFVHYAASDVRLTPRPVTISMAEKKDGPYTILASGLENSGVYAWEMPKELPYQFFVKVEAEDKAGNVGGGCTAEPIKVDMSRPRGTILGVEQKSQVGFDR